jgi:hypothetical protein
LKKPPTLKADKRRTTVANEAARIIQEHGLSDFRFAKEKAVERLGLKNNGALPSNQEIERALAERNRIFKGQSHLTHLNNLRKAALSAMNSLNVFHVRLAGPVLSGNATEHSQIDLHLFTDSQESVAITLNELGIRHRSIQIRQRFRRRQSETFPGYRFNIEGSEFSATVFPELLRRYAPLSLVDGKPMQRAGIRELQRLLSEA